MKCIVCNNEYEKMEGCICHHCEEADYIYSFVEDAYHLWLESLRYEDNLWENTSKIIDGLTLHLDKTLDNIENICIILDKLKELIIHSIKLYKKVDIIASGIMIKEICRRELIFIASEVDVWKIHSEYKLALELIRISLEIEESEFLGFSICEEDEYGNCSFISAIALLRFYINILENKNNAKFIKKEYTLDEMLFDFIEDEAMRKFFYEYGMMAGSEKPEDYNIQDEKLNIKLENNKNSKKDIINLTNEVINKGFNFSLDSLKSLASLKRVQKNNYSIINIERKTSFKKKNYCINAENIIQTFSLNNIKKDVDGEFSVYDIELASFYEYEDYIIWGEVDFIQNISTFEKFSMSSHFLERYNLNEEIIKESRQIQTKLSTYLSYVIADLLYSKGYKLPMEKIEDGYAIKAEIDKIKVSNKNILNTYGDIDVLALDENKKEILNIEFKHYKPAMNMKELMYNDKSKIEDKRIVDKVKKREGVIKENISEVVRFLGGNEKEKFNVKSIIITSRPNFYAINMSKSVEYMTWNQFISWIEK